MKNEAKIWLEYAAENLQSSTVLLENSLFNPCIQNARQSVAKTIKEIIEIAKRIYHEINNQIST